MSVKASQISFNEAILRLAWIHGREVEFRYEKGTDQPIETRSFRPESINYAKSGVVFVGYDPDRNDVRAFRVDRIRGDVRIV